MNEQNPLLLVLRQSQTEVAQLIAGADAFICDESVELGMSIGLNHRTEKRPLRPPLSVETNLVRVERDINRDIDYWMERLQLLKQIQG